MAGIPVICLAWKSRQMAAPAFWYFETSAQAERAAEELQSSTVYTIYPTVIAPLYDDRVTHRIGARSHAR